MQLWQFPLVSRQLQDPAEGDAKQSEETWTPALSLGAMPGVGSVGVSGYQSTLCQQETWQVLQISKSALVFSISAPFL